MLDSQLMQCFSYCSPVSSSTLVGRCKRRQWLAFSTPQRSQVASGRPPFPLPFLSKGSFHPIPQFKHPSLCFSVLFLIHDTLYYITLYFRKRDTLFPPLPVSGGRPSLRRYLTLFLLCCFVGTKDLGTSILCNWITTKNLKCTFS